MIVSKYLGVSRNQDRLLNDNFFFMTKFKKNQFNAELYITLGRVGWNDEIFLKKVGIQFVNILFWLFREIKSFINDNSSNSENIATMKLIDNFLKGE